MKFCLYSHPELRAMRTRAQDALVSVVAEPENARFRSTLHASLSALLDAHIHVVLTAAVDTDDNVLFYQFSGIKSLYTGIKRHYDYGGRSGVFAHEVDALSVSTMTAILHGMGQSQQVGAIQTPTGWSRVVTKVTIPELRGDSHPADYFVKAMSCLLPPAPASAEQKIIDTLYQDPALRVYVFEKCCVCKKTSGLRRCKRCKRAFYCSPEHQRAHWETHKIHCRQLRDL